MASTSFPTDLQGRIQLISKERTDAIARFAMLTKKGVPDRETYKERYERLDKFLAWLDSDVDMSPELKEKTKIDEGLRLITDHQMFHFPEDVKAKAKALNDKWVAQNWGKTAPAVQPPQQNGQNVPDDEDESEDEEDSATPVRPAAGHKRKANSSVDIKMPPYDHPIWGRSGIMHGLALKRGNGDRKSTVVNPELKDQQRPAKVYGHNDITVGRWFPIRLSALFHGAHGSSQAGIVAGPEGAYSIVVSGEYDDLDNDYGETLHYSGSGSHANTDPKAPAPTPGTAALYKSVETGKPVRVLRSHSGKSSWAPTKGVRYDGLYRVVEQRTARNRNGGLYERFKLVRLDEDEDDQLSLEKCKRRPNGQDLRDHERIELGYPSRRG